MRHGNRLVRTECAVKDTGRSGQGVPLSTQGQESFQEVFFCAGFSLLRDKAQYFLMQELCRELLELSRD